MEIRHRILEFNNSPKFNILKEILDKLALRYTITQLGGKMQSLEYYAYEKDVQFPYISEVIRKHHLYVQVGIEYSPEDFNNAEWFYAIGGEYLYPQPEDTWTGWDSNGMEVTYDLANFHSYCGIGAVQARPFRLKSDFKQKKIQFLGLHWVFDEIFVRPEAKIEIENAGFDGINFIHPVFHKTGLPIESVLQMKIQNMAKPGLVTKDLQPVTCKRDNEEGFYKNAKDFIPCGRVKYHFPNRTMMTFYRDSMKDLPDIARSSEYFGSGGAANHLILVSRRFLDFYNQHGFRGLKFTPIELV